MFQAVLSHVFDHGRETDSDLLRQSEHFLEQVARLYIVLRASGLHLASVEARYMAMRFCRCGLRFGGPLYTDLVSEDVRLATR